MNLWATFSPIMSFIYTVVIFFLLILIRSLSIWTIDSRVVTSQPFADLTSIPRKSAISQDEMTEDYLFTAVPIIITDAMSDWKAFNELDFDIDFVIKVQVHLYCRPIFLCVCVCSYAQSLR